MREELRICGFCEIIRMIVGTWASNSQLTTVHALFCACEIRMLVKFNEQPSVGRRPIQISGYVLVEKASEWR